MRRTTGFFSGSRRHGCSDTFDDLIGRRDLTLGVGLLAIALALVLGASHALLPGHGKTVMAAYIAGRQGSVRDAVIVGATVTGTHTGGVLVLGLALTLSTSLAGETVLGWLGVASGVLVAVLGVGLLLSAARHRGTGLFGHGHTHGYRFGGHTHDHDHDGGHGHGHPATGTPTRATGTPTRATGTRTRATGTTTRPTGMPTRAMGTRARHTGTATRATGTPTRPTGTATLATGTRSRPTGSATRGTGRRRPGPFPSVPAALPPGSPSGLRWRRSAWRSTGVCWLAPSSSGAPALRWDRRRRSSSPRLLDGTATRAPAPPVTARPPVVTRAAPSPVDPEAIAAPKVSPTAAWSGWASPVASCRAPPH